MTKYISNNNTNKEQTEMQHPIIINYKPTISDVQHLKAIVAFEKNHKINIADFINDNNFEKVEFINEMDSFELHCTLPYFTGDSLLDFTEFLINTRCNLLNSIETDIREGITVSFEIVSKNICLPATTQLKFGTFISGLKYDEPMGELWTHEIIVPIEDLESLNLSYLYSEINTTLGDVEKLALTEENLLIKYHLHASDTIGSIENLEEILKYESCYIEGVLNAFGINNFQHKIDFDTNIVIENVI